MKLDLDFVRAQFPAFSQAGLKDQAFFENAGGSYPCVQVIDRLTRFYRERKVQPYGAYEPSRAAGLEMDEARERLAAMLNVGSDELSFGPSTTQNTYVLAQAFGEMLKPGDAIVVTDQDHEANSGPWRRLAHRGIEIREWKLAPHTGHLDTEALRRLIDDNVKLVCFPHCSNIVAEINPVAEIANIAHAAGAYVCVDGVSYAAHGLPDIKALGADIYLFSTYKTYGPHQGVMTIRREIGEKLPNQGHYFNAGALTKRFTPAGPDHAQIAACAGIADYFEALYAHHFSDARSPTKQAEAVHNLMRAHEIALLQPLFDFLSTKSGMRLVGPREAANRAPTVSILLSEPGASVAEKLASKGVMAGGGSFYGVRCLEALGIDPNFGVLRVSFVHYTSAEDISRLTNALDELIS